MSASTAFARVVVDELIRGGVREAVLAPGSRNAPLSYALHDAEVAGRLRLHVRIDERTAGFLALGLAKVSGLPVPVVCTSGTAVANLHPAVLEAHHSGVPVLALTADRPPELRGTGANQATEQPAIFGSAVRYNVDFGVPEQRAGQSPYWRSTVCRALAAAAGTWDGDPGPVHLNLPLREPLVPGDEEDEAGQESLEGRPGGLPWVRVDRARWASSAGSGSLAGQTGQTGQAGPTGLINPAGLIESDPERTVVILGDGPGWLTELGAEFAVSRSWPLLAEPTASRHSAVLRTGTLLLGTPGWLKAHRPDRVIVVGRPTLSRAVGALLRDPRVAVELVPASARWPDPGHSAQRVRCPESMLGGHGKADDSSGCAESEFGSFAAWADSWAAADELVSAAVDELLDQTGLSGLAVAREVVAAIPSNSLLVLGASQPIRDAELVAAPRPDLSVIANRGLAGIDGTVSTAMGAALAYQAVGDALPGGSPAVGGPAYALLGDLTFLHDGNGLLLGPEEPRPDLTIVVVNNDGGGIFGLLEQGGAGSTAVFERVFATPHGADLRAWCAATGTRYSRCEFPGELPAALAYEPGIRVVEVRTDRQSDRELHEQLRSTVTAALS